MKLAVNFTEIDKALEKMGAKPIAFDVDVNRNPVSQIDVDLEIGIELPDLSALEVDNGLLSFKGRQILLYIQDHSWNIQKAIDNGREGKKFHVADCKTLKDMRARGRFERYVVTNKLDGEFRITGVDHFTRVPVEGNARLWVCQNCLKHLNYKGAKHGRSYDVAASFKIDEFFATYSSFFSHLPKRNADQTGASGYTKDWPRIAAELKAKSDFRCSSCEVNLTSNVRLLHVHHKDGVKSNNRRSNLEVLCACCHRDQAFHEHMFVSHEDTKEITRLRREQGLLNDPGWVEVMELADPSLRGILDSCKRAHAPLPNVGLDVQNSRGKVIGMLEVAWTDTRVALAIGEKDRTAGREAGWKVWEMIEALDDESRFLSEVVG